MRSEMVGGNERDCPYRSLLWYNKIGEMLKERGRTVRREKNRYVFASDPRRFRRPHRLLRALLLLVPLLALVFVITNLAVSRRVKLETMRLTVLNLPLELEEYSILHISDLHGARYGEQQKAIKTALDTTRYSCVVMTGDMLGENGDVEPLLELLALMPADTPKYLIPGDMDGTLVDTTAHGSLSPYSDWAERLQQAGVTLLDRPVSETRGKGKRGEGTIWFVPEDVYLLDLDVTESTCRKQLAALNERAATLSADDAARIRALEYELERVEAIREAKAQFLPEHIQIALTHFPLTDEYVRSLGSWTGKEQVFSLRYASLILAGHYNGGQWRIPGVGAAYVPELGWFPPDSEVQGLSHPGGVPQYISPGLGSDPHYEHQPGRIYNSPVMTKIILTRKEQ